MAQNMHAVNWFRVDAEKRPSQWVRKAKEEILSEAEILTPITPYFFPPLEMP